MRSRSLNSRSFLIILISIILCLIFIASLRNHARGIRDSEYATVHLPSTALPLPELGGLAGPAIASKLKNETLKTELGRAAWKVFHTTFAAFPDKPTADQSAALQAYIHLFQRLYPCGECAQHFGHILEQFPPQVSSRSTAAAWGCHVHNEVNKSLGKELFDCSKIGDFYDCGCGDDETDTVPTKGASAKVANEIESDLAADETEPVTLNREEWQRGG